MFDEPLLRVCPSEDGLCLMPSGDLDGASCASFAVAVDGMMSTLGGVIVDMSDVTTMDPAGLRVLCGATGRGPVELRHVPAAIRRLIASSGLEEALGLDAIPSADIARRRSTTKDRIAR